MSKLGGATVRSVLAQQQEFIDRRQRWIVRQGVARLRNWVVALGIKSGRIPECKDPEWWKHGWMFGARQSADFAKDNRALMEIVNRGELSPDTFHAFSGRKVDAEDERTLARWVKRKEMCDAKGLRLETVWPPAPGTPAATAEITPEQMEEIKTNDDETKA